MVDTIPDHPTEDDPPPPARPAPTRIDTPPPDEDTVNEPGAPGADGSAAGSSPSGHSFPPTGSPRDTIPDQEAPQPAAKSNRGKILAVTFVVLAAIGIAVSMGLYWWVFRYERRAHLHLPANASFAVRVELAELATFPPMRKRLEEARERQSKDGKRLTEAVEKATGVKATDLRELVIATADTQSWVAIVGGRITKGRVVSGLAEVLRAEGVQGFEQQDGLLVGPKAVVGQADDGSIVIGTDAAIVKAALPAAEDAPRIQLPAARAVYFVATQELWTGAAWHSALPNSMALRKIAHAEGDLSLGDKPAFDVRIDLQKGENAAEFAKDLEGMFSAFRIASLFLPDVAGEQGLVAGAEVSVEGERVRVKAPWSVEGAEKAMAKLRDRTP